LYPPQGHVAETGPGEKNNALGQKTDEGGARHKATPFHLQASPKARGEEKYREKKRQPETHGKKREDG